MHELVLRVGEALVEAVSDALIDQLGALSVSVEDARAGSESEVALFGEPGLPPPAEGWPTSTLRALFARETEAREAAAALVDDSVTLETIAELPEQDWVRLTQSQFTPVPVTEGFWIVPSWHARPEGARTVLRLDPGLAFGTGTHPTTQMCLRWIAGHAAQLPGLRLLDYGCGSGILAIASGLHGATDIDAVDIDLTAVQSTAANAQANGVVLRAALPDAAAGHYGVVLANILASPLKLLAPLLCNHLDDGGELVLAGILQRQADELRAAYAPWLALDVADQQDGWILMTGRRGDPR